MTKTYNDIDAVTRLLEEVAQLHHELNLKDELLQFYTNAAEESEDESSTSPTGKKSKVDSALGGFLSDTLQRKLKDLEEENLSLRSEAHHLKSETETYEEKEQQLVNDCVKELRLSSLQISTIAEELARKTEDASRQQEEITHLLSQIVDLQKKAKSYAVENEELSQHLVAAKDAQRQLTAELQELDGKYLECIEMLHEAQEELKNLRNRNFPAGTPRRCHPLGLYPMEDPECEEQKIHRKRVFETVKNVNQTVRQRSLTPTNANIPGSNQSLSARTSPQSSGLTTPHSSISTEGREKKASGAEDLRLALRRLSLRRQNNLSERRFFEDERERRRGGHGGVHDALGQECGQMTPSESIMSLGNLHLWASRGPYLPDKLQIVKPLEGEGERESEVSCKAGRKGEGDPHRGKGSKRGSGTEGERERERGWGWARKTKAGIERERGRRWARDRAGSRKMKGAKERKERPLSLMLFNSFWSLMHHHKSGSFASPHSYYKDTQPRGWL
ncbi:hypothetical protein FQN60_007718 [Etheostoma spectabile]|uniref:HAP1 N-terminal domain-containing protein n=1 Tax=Etheostoma spectabile TaxID=54343 RepID=A0A5J5CYB7_9PERO|nr:hypothetical protein FQN60_007718 [Etheostoma spectabile]